MQIDSAVLYIFRKELAAKIIPAQVRQIHQIDNRIIDIELFRSYEKSIHLIFDTYRPLIYITENLKKDTGYMPSQTFCMTLRKQLEGSRLSSIEQPDFDRFLKFNFDRIEAGGKIITKSLCMELIPSAPNLILTEDNVIIDACLRGKKMERILAPGKPYVRNSYASRNNFLLFSAEEILQILKFGQLQDSSVQQWIFDTFNGFSSFLAEELFSRTKIKADLPLNHLNEEESTILANTIYDIAQEILSAKALYIYKKPNNKTWATPITLSAGEPIRKISADRWIREELQKDGGILSAETSQMSQKISSLLKKETRKMNKIKDELKETKKTETYKLWGTLLSIYAYKKLNGMHELTVSNVFNEPPTDESIPVNPLLSVSQNSQLYFKKYSKMKTRLQVGQDKLNECFAKIRYLENISYFLENIKTKNELIQLKDELKDSGATIQRHSSMQRKKEKEPSFISLTIDGFHVLLGKNNVQNEYLTFHKAGKEDLWFHAQALPGSHVVLITEGQVIPKELIAKTAALAAFYSKGKSSGKVNVDYTRIKYVKKIPNSPPGLVNYTHQSTVTVIPEDFKISI